MASLVTWSSDPSHVHIQCSEELDRGREKYKNNILKLRRPNRNIHFHLIVYEVITDSHCHKVSY